DFARVNVGHDEDNRQSARVRTARIDDACRPGDHQRQRTPFVRGGERLDTNVGISALNRGDELHHLRISRRRSIVRAFGCRSLKFLRQTCLTYATEDYRHPDAEQSEAEGSQVTPSYREILRRLRDS